MWLIRGAVAGAWRTQKMVLAMFEVVHSALHWFLRDGICVHHLIQSQIFR
jgi:hypothetical protein